MCNIDVLLKEGTDFIGIISSYHGEDEFRLINKSLKDLLDSGGGIVYICSKPIEVGCINNLKGEWGKDFEYILNSDRLVFICRDYYLNENGVDIDGFLKTIKKGISRLNRMESNTSIVFMTFDSLWSPVVKEDLKLIHEAFKDLSKSYGTKFLIRYFIDKFKNEYMDSLLKYYDFILVDGIDSFQVYTPEDLIHDALRHLSEDKAMEHMAREEIIRTEYLRNLGELLEGTLHDINNLLVSIIGYAQLSQNLDDLEEIKEYLEIIAKVALDGEKITNRIKEKIKGNYESLKEVYYFNYIINNCVEMVKHKFKIPGMDIVVDLNTDSYIYCNEYDIRHSIVNIMLNGVDAMEGLGTLTIRSYEKEDHIVLEISDTGKGMDQSTMDRIFEPYFTTKGSKGTGLGLSLAKRIFNMHNGEIQVESQLGKGTKFTILLPIYKYEDKVAEAHGDNYKVNKNKIL